MEDPISLSLPDVSQLEVERVAAAIRSGWVAPLGPDVDAFEAELAEYCCRAECVALSSGTAALHLGLLALGVREGSVVLAASMTFAATANAIVYTGAEPMFIDSGPDGSIDAQLLESALKDLAGENRRVGAVIPVDLLGQVVDHPRIESVAAKYGVPVLSDAAEAMGSRLEGRPAASYGRAAVLSFNGNKIMTTSGGGALLTDDGKLAAQVRHLATQARQPVVWYEHTEIGYNYRLSNLLAALGRAQLLRLDSMITRRREVREGYRTLFAGMPGVELFGGAGTEDNAWLSAVVVDSAVAGWSAGQLGETLRKEGIETRPLWKPMHLQPVFSEARSWVNGNSERLFKTGLALPSGSSLSSVQRERVLGVINVFLREHAP